MARSRPGHRSHCRVAADDPVEPGHDEFAASTSFVWAVGIIPGRDDAQPRFDTFGLGLAPIAPRIRRERTPNAASRFTGKGATSMSRGIRRFMPIAALCLATLLGGCVIVPERHAYYAPGPVVWGGGWGWHR